MRKNLNKLPDHLPQPIDDGMAHHLIGAEIPLIRLKSTTGIDIEVAEEFKDPAVLFIYPRAGSPLAPNTNPQLWDKIPGARGCTPQSCGFRDLHQEFSSLGYKVFGLSTQSNKIQTEFVERNHIPFSILSDFEYQFADKLNLPVFTFEGERLLKRMALVIDKGKIIKVFYPVFPPNKNAEVVLDWLKSKQ